jgi:hypothetical protein
MSLINPFGPSFKSWSDNLSDASTGTSYGTVHEAGINGGTPADSTPGTILSALAHDCEYLILGFSGFGRNGFDTATLLDVLYDPAGGTSWTELIPDLLVGMIGATMDMAPAAGAAGVPLMYHFPIWIPAGSSVGVRAKTVSASSLSVASRVVMMAAGDNERPASWWCGQKVTPVGTFSQSTCRGQSHTPGQSTFSSWTSLGSALSQGIGAVQYAVQSQITASQPAGAARFEFGAGSNRIGPPIWLGMGQVENTSRWLPGPIFCSLPEGTQMQVRGSLTRIDGLAPNACDVAAYVVS